MNKQILSVYVGLCAVACMQLGCENVDNHSASAVWDVSDKQVAKAEDIGKMSGLDWNNRTRSPEIALKVLHLLKSSTISVYGEGLNNSNESSALYTLVLADIKLNFAEADWSQANQAAEWFIQTLDSMFNVNSAWSVGYNSVDLANAFLSGAETVF